MKITSELSILPNRSLEPKFDDKDGGATIAGVIAAIGAIAKLMSDIGGVGDDAQSVIRKIREIAKNVEKIKDIIIEIQKELEQLPLVIDEKLEEKFSNFVNYRLRALISMYLEIKEGIIDAEEVPTVILKLLGELYHDIRVESRVMMNYGTPAIGVISLSYSIEDDCARLLGLGGSFRRSGLTTSRNFLQKILSGGEDQPAKTSVVGYKNELQNLNDKFSDYFEWLDENFVAQTNRWASNWVLIRSTGSILRGGYHIYERWHFVSSVSGNTNDGFTYSETKSREEKSERYHGEEEGGPERDRVHEDPKNHFGNKFDKNESIFRRNLDGSNNSVMYVNLMINKRHEINESYESLSKLVELITSAIGGIDERMETLD
jgi:hypothetical protein